MDKIQKILAAQFVMIDWIITNCNYIFRHNEEQNKDNHEISNNEYLRYIARLVSDDTIVNLYKLLKATQHHSFQNLNSKVNHLTEQEGFDFRTEDKKHYFDGYLTAFDDLLELYHFLNYEGIRNKYVGHLDMNRILIPFELDDLSKVKDYLIEIKTNLHHAFYDFEEPQLNNQRVLLELIEDNIKINNKSIT